MTEKLKNLLNKIGLKKIKEFIVKSAPVTVPTLVMVIICIVVTGALAVTNLVTKDKITEINIKEQNDSMKEVLSAKEYKEKSITLKLNKGESKSTYTYFEALDGEKIKGYIYVLTEKGYGGDVKVMTAVKENGEIKAVKVLDVSNETPGLGQNTGNKEWYSQFKGLTLKKEIEVLKGTAGKDTNGVNAVTGATISSKAVTKAVNTAGKINKAVTKKGDK